MQKNYAFTLSEILITLGIIGVIAALTLPTINAIIFEKQTVNVLKQSYSIITGAVKMMEEEEECLGGSCYTKYSAPEIEAIASNIDRHFKYADKICYAKPADTYKVNVDWLPDKTYSLNGAYSFYSTYTVQKYSRADNSGVCYYKLLNGATVSISRMNAFNNSETLNIVIDTNGKARPNRVGKDTFPISSVGDYPGVIPYYSIHPWASPTFYNGLCSYRAKNSCKPDEKSPAAYVLTYGKLPNLEKAGFPKKP